MTAIFQPWTSGTDVIGGTFSLDFDQNWKVDEIFAVPRLKWLEQLKARALRVNVDFQR